MPNILLLGADEATVSLYRTQFERAGVALASSEIVEPVADFIRMAQPSAVLLDVSRSKSEGRDLVRGIRSEPDFKSLPLFALTDHPIVWDASGATVPTGITRSFHNLPAMVPEVVQAVTDAMNRDGHACGVVSGETNPGEDGDPEPRNGKPEPAENAACLIKQLTESFRSFCGVASKNRGDTLLKMQEQVRTLRRTFLANNSPALIAFSSALVKLFITLSKDLGRINPSSLRTLSSAIDALALSVTPPPGAREIKNGPVRVLIVDDEPLSRHALHFALSSPDLELADFDGIERALECLRTHEFDVVFADLKMVRSGDFSAQLRRLPNHSDIPLVIVTSLPDFEGRVQSALSGGCDLIAKPFTPSEVVVKAFTFALRRRLGRTSISGVAEASTPVAGTPLTNLPRNGTHADTLGLPGEAPARNGFSGGLPPDLGRDRQVTPLSPGRVRADAVCVMRAADGQGFDTPKSEPTPPSKLPPAPERSELVSATPPPVNGVASNHHPKPSPDPMEPLSSNTGERPPAPAPFEPIPGAASISEGDDELRRKFEEVAACHVLTDELNRMRSQLLAERARRQTLDAAINELETAKEELAGKLEAVIQRELAQQNLVQSLQSRLQDSTIKLGSVEAALQSQIRECKRQQLRSKDLEEQLAELSSQVTTQLAIEQSRRRREAELQSCVLNQQAEIAKSKAALAADGANMQRAREQIQSALSRVMQDLKTQDS